MSARTLPTVTRQPTAADGTQEIDVEVDLAKRILPNVGVTIAETWRYVQAPDVPSVLIELGYLSNAGDADQMNNARWRDRMAQAIAAAIDRFFGPSTVADP